MGRSIVASTTRHGFFYYWPPLLTPHFFITDPEGLLLTPDGPIITDPRRWLLTPDGPIITDPRRWLLTPDGPIITDPRRWLLTPSWKFWFKISFRIESITNIQRVQRISKVINSLIIYTVNTQLSINLNGWDVVECSVCVRFRPTSLIQKHVMISLKFYNINV